MKSAFLNLLFPLGLLITSYSFAQPQTCPAKQNWDDDMKMCMPDNCADGEHWDQTTKKCVKDSDPHHCEAGQHWDEGMQMCMPDTAPIPTDPHNCEPGSHWDASMGMCMPDLQGSTQLSFDLNQYAIGITESGPRGRTALSAPNMFMLDFMQVISDCDSVKVQWMGTTDLWTTPSKGTPNLLQVGEANSQGVPFIDAQHPHTSPIMGLTFAEVHCFGKTGDKKLTLFFSPRGQATAGPQNFMMRPSGEGNPNAPLSHHLQDVFHIMSTVLGAKYTTGKWTIEGSVFSGQEPSPTKVNLDVHTPDSGGIRIGRDLGHGVQVGASIANTLENSQPRLSPGGVLSTPPSHRQNSYSAWVMTDHQFKKSSLSTSTIWGQTGEDQVRLNGFLNEMVYRFGDMQSNHLFTRFEVLQRTPEQLEINVVGNASNPEWVKALTVGYERRVMHKKSYSTYLGGSVTHDFLPADFKASYGGNPNAAEIHLRVKLNKAKSWDTEPPVPGFIPSTYSWIHYNIISKKCASCHTSTQGDGDGLDYANFDSYDTLIKSLKTGDPAGSTLYQMVKTQKMPRAMDGEPKPHPLNPNELQAIWTWIQDGAKNN
jgi:hypothetical protein